VLSAAASKGAQTVQNERTRDRLLYVSEVQVRAPYTDGIGRCSGAGLDEPANGAVDLISCIIRDLDHFQIPAGVFNFCGFSR
jgi:hypothetical protein